jgi:hypothetical protein
MMQHFKTQFWIQQTLAGREKKYFVIIPMRTSWRPSSACGSSQQQPADGGLPAWSRILRNVSKDPHGAPKGAEAHSQGAPSKVGLATSAVVATVGAGEDPAITRETPAEDSLHIRQ